MEQEDGVLRTILADLKSNVDHTREAGLNYWARVVGKLLFAPNVQVVVVYRLSSFLYRFTPTKPLAYLLRGLTVVWGGTEIHPAAVIGPGLCLVHSHKVVIGAGVRMPHSFGSAMESLSAVILGGTVRPTVPGGPASGTMSRFRWMQSIPGPLTIGDGAVVGAQSFVVTDVPARTLVVGAPARVVREVG